MNILAIIQLIGTLEPEVIQLVEVIMKAVSAAPAPHQQAVATAAAAVLQKSTAS